MSLADEDTGVVDRLGQAELEDLRLEATVKEVLDLETQDVVELHLVLLEDSVADQAAKECIALEQTLGVLKQVKMRGAEGTKE